MDYQGYCGRIGLQIHVNASDNTVNVSSTGDLDCAEVDNLITALNLAKQLAGVGWKLAPRTRGENEQTRRFD